MIFNRSITEKTFPSKLKLGRVCPIPKTSKPTVKDFRPITILSSISKVFEQLIMDRVKDRLISYYGKQQHAFRPFGSITSALIDITNTISLALDSHDVRAVHLPCLDVSKAFDKLHHNRLLNYLNDREMDHGFLLWLKSFLSADANMFL